MVFIEDWTDEATRIEELRQAVHTDDLTGLLNRRGLWRHVDELDPGAYPLVLALVDVDRLKSTNDDRGHAAGDLVLRTVASRLDGLIGPGAIAARLSGDEFVVLAPASAWTPAGLADAVHRRVGSGPTAMAAGGSRVPLSVSVGTAVVERAERYSAALAEADAAMYADKARTR